MRWTFVRSGVEINYARCPTTRKFPEKSLSTSCQWTPELHHKLNDRKMLLVGLHKLLSSSSSNLGRVSLWKHTFARLMKACKQPTRRPRLNSLVMSSILTHPTSRNDNSSRFNWEINRNHISLHWKKKLLRFIYKQNWKNETRRWKIPEIMKTFRQT